MILALSGPARATFPGNSGLIVFDTGDGPRSQIYTVAADGRRLRQLTHGGRGQRTDPHWSADGSRIAYVSDESGSPQIWMMRRDGSGQHRVTHDPGADFFSPSWSRDGRTILVSRCSHLLGTCDVVVMGANGMALRTLIGGYWHHGQTAYSPDGTRIAYTSDEGGYDSLLWIADAHGGHRRHITPPPLAADRPSWAPGGTRLSFTGDPHNGKIFTVDPRGRHLRRVPAPPDTLFGSYSPDGRELVAVGPDPGCHCPALHIMRPDGTHNRALKATRLPGVKLSDWSVAR
jgi:TolB protein